MKRRDEDEPFRSDQLDRAVMIGLCLALLAIALVLYLLLTP